MTYRVEIEKYKTLVLRRTRYKYRVYWTGCISLFTDVWEFGRAGTRELAEAKANRKIEKHVLWRQKQDAKRIEKADRITSYYWE